jgi:hypothetical protein
MFTRNAGRDSGDHWRATGNDDLCVGPRLKISPDGTYAPKLPAPTGRSSRRISADGRLPPPNSATMETRWRRRLAGRRAAAWRLPAAHAAPTEGGDAAPRRRNDGLATAPDVAEAATTRWPCSSIKLERQEQLKKRMARWQIDDATYTPGRVVRDQRARRSSASRFSAFRHNGVAGASSARQRCARLQVERYCDTTDGAPTLWQRRASAGDEAVSASVSTNTTGLGLCRKPLGLGPAAVALIPGFRPGPAFAPRWHML